MDRFRRTGTGRFVMAVIGIMVFSSIIALAQPGGSPTPSPTGAVQNQPGGSPTIYDPTADPAVVTAPQLTSVGAVMGATIFLTLLAKKGLQDKPGFQRLPIWVYVCFFSIGLTFLGNKVLGTLQGEFWLLCWSAIYNGAAASGVREWVYSGLTKPISAEPGKL